MSEGTKGLINNGLGRLEGGAARLKGLTPSATGFLVTAVHAVSVCITAPAQGDAVATLALELVHVTAGGAVFLWAWEPVVHSGPQGTALTLLRLSPSLRLPFSPRLSHRHSHGPRHTSNARRCNGHWHRRTRSQSRAEELGKDRPQQGGHRASPVLGLIFPSTRLISMSVRPLV